MPLLLRANKPLPANPEGAAALAKALSTAEQAPVAWTANHTPETAAQISGNTYVCESNPAGIETMRMEFDGTEQGTLFLKMGGTDMILPIGLDGSYRLSPEGSGFRGYWEDAQNFYFENFNIGVVSRQVHIDGDSLELSLPEAELTITCQAQDT